MNNINDSQDITDIHLGLDLSLKGTGLCFYLENKQKNFRQFKFYILVYDKSIATHFQNVNQIKLAQPKIIEDMDLNHNEDFFFNNSVSFTKSQMDHTKIFVTVASMIIKKVRQIITENNLEHNKINLYLNMEGSLLSGYDFNSQVALNMLQGLLRGDIIKLHLSNNFNKLKFRIVPAKALKLFFSRDGNADKTGMMKAFIDYYDGKKLIPQLNTDKRTVDKLNDIVDSFALVAYNIYDITLGDKQKLLFNPVVNKDHSLIKKKRVARKPKMVTSTGKNLPKINADFFDNLDSQIIKNNNIL